MPGYISERRAAASAYISPATWRLIERGGRSTPATITRMAQAVGLDIREALELAGFDPAEVRLTDHSDDTERGLLIAAVRDLSPDDVRAVAALVDALRTRAPRSTSGTRGGGRDT